MTCFLQEVASISKNASKKTREEKELEKIEKRKAKELAKQAKDIAKQEEKQKKLDEKEAKKKKQDQEKNAKKVFITDCCILIQCFRVKTRQALI